MASPAFTLCALAAVCVLTAWYLHWARHRAETPYLHYFAVVVCFGVLGRYLPIPVSLLLLVLILPAALLFPWPSRGKVTLLAIAPVAALMFAPAIYARLFAPGNAPIRDIGTMSAEERRIAEAISSPDSYVTYDSSRVGVGIDVIRTVRSGDAVFRFPIPDGFRYSMTNYGRNGEKHFALFLDEDTREHFIFTVEGISRKSPGPDPLPGEKAFLASAAMAERLALRRARELGGDGTYKLAADAVVARNGADSLVYLASVDAAAENDGAVEMKTFVVMPGVLRVLDRAMTFIIATEQNADGHAADLPMAWLDELAHVNDAALFPLTPDEEREARPFDAVWEDETEESGEKAGTVYLFPGKRSFYR